MREVQKLMDDIHQWADKTFGPERTVEAPLHHLKKEAQEVIDEIYEGKWTSALEDTASRDKIKEEFADCFILILNAASKYGMDFYDLMTEAETKMEKNKLRKWGKPDENGVVEHIRG